MTRPAFELHLDGFEGPFDLLLDLIGRRELEVTELALADVTDEFLAHLAALPDDGDLDETSGFLVVGATLLDLKIAGLLPHSETVDAESVAALEARDLLFARLLQYRAFQRAAAWFEERLAAESARHPRHGVVEARLRRPAEPVRIGADLAAFAALAAVALAPRPSTEVAIDHLHVAPVSLRAQAGEVVALLRAGEPMSFLDLADGPRPVVVARFLAVLELYRLGALEFEQIEPLGALVLTWVGSEFDEGLLDRLGAEAA